MAQILPKMAETDNAKSLFHRCHDRASQMPLLSVHAGSPMLYCASAFPSSVDVLISNSCFRPREFALPYPPSYIVHAIRCKSAVLQSGTFPDFEGSIDSQIWPSRSKLYS